MELAIALFIVDLSYHYISTIAIFEVWSISEEVA
jgi:hypothetical protein